MKRKDIIAIVVSFVLIVLIVGLSYAYFALNTNLTNNISQNLTFNEDYSFDVEVSNRNANPFTITNTDMIYSGVDEVVANTSENFIINVTNNSEDTLYCTYDIVWEWQSGTGLSNYTISSGATKEYTVSWNGTEVQVPNYNASSFVLYKSGTSGVASGTTESYIIPFETKFYNLADVDQSGHFNKTYLGYAKIDNVACSNTISLTKYISYVVPKSGTSAVGNTPWIISEDHPGEYRYAGKNPDNYVQFNGELWRIIGVMPNMTYCTGEYGNANECNTTTTGTLVKIIRNASLGDFFWDQKYSPIGSSVSGSASNDWSDSQLMLMLNGTNYLTTGYDANGTRLHTSYTVTDGMVADSNGYNFYSASYNYLDGNGTRVNRPSYAQTSGYTVATSTVNKKMELSMISKIATVKWDLYGAATYGTDAEGSPPALYNKERNINNSGLVYTNESLSEKRPVYWYGKIGLMYPSDYGYSTNGGSTYNRDICLGSYVYGWLTKTDCIRNSYLYFNNITSSAPGTSGKAQWTITSDTSYYFTVFRIDTGGNLYCASTAAGVRPVLYLKADTLYGGSGTGTWDDPYTIE